MIMLMCKCNYIDLTGVINVAEDKMVQLLNSHLGKTDAVKRMHKFQQEQVEFDKSMKELLETMHQGDDILVRDFIEREYTQRLKIAQRDAMATYDKLVEAFNEQHKLAQDDLERLEKGELKIESLTDYQVRDFAKRRDEMVALFEKKQRWTFKRILKFMFLALLVGAAFGLGLAIIYVMVMHPVGMISLDISTVIVSVSLICFISDSIKAQRLESKRRAMEDPLHLASLGRHHKMSE